LWKLYPDLRFGQLVIFIEESMKKETPYYAEEDKWIRTIEKLITEKKNKKTPI